MGRSPCCDDSGLKKGPWTPEEDQKLIKYIQKHGHGSWRALPKLAGLNRCGKSCRLRWTNYLRPDIKRGKFSQEEEQTILNLHSILGNKWSAIATRLPGRTDNEIKNFWNTHLKKKLIQMGFDPMTHRPRTDIFATLPHLLALANLMDHASSSSSSLEEQAHIIRLQSEAAQMAKLQYLQYLLQPPPVSTFQQNGVVDLEGGYNLLMNSLLSDPAQMSSLTAAAGVNFPAINDSVPEFSHLPDLQIPSSFQESTTKDEMVPNSNLTVISHGENSPPSPWLPSISSPSFAAEGSVAAAAAAAAAGAGDACSTSSFGGGGGGGQPLFWPVDLLLEDSLFHELA